MYRSLAAITIMLGAFFASGAPVSASVPIQPSDPPYPLIELVSQATPAAAPDDEGGAELAYTFGRIATQRLYSAYKAGGSAAATAYCLAAAEVPFKVYCAMITVVVYELTNGPPADTACYQLFLKFGWPPAGARIITCSKP